MTPLPAAAMVALGYIRRSKESTARTVSLQDQEEHIRAYTQAQGWQLAEILADDGVSGGRRERFQRLDARIRETGAQIVVIYHLDRLARDAAALLDWIERAAPALGVELHVAGRGRIEAQSATGYLMAGVEGLLAAHYRKVVSEKTRSALALVRARGRWLGGTPLGFTRRDGRLVADPAGQRLVDEILQLRRAGLTERAIAAQVGRSKNGIHQVLIRDRHLHAAAPAVA